MKLAARLGRTKAELDETLSLDEFWEQQALNLINPPTEEVIVWMLAGVQFWLYRLYMQQGGVKPKLTVKDFMPEFDKQGKAKPINPQALREMAKAANRAFGGRTRKEGDIKKNPPKGNTPKGSSAKGKESQRGNVNRQPGSHPVSSRRKP